jgi:hypothetical protein
VGGRLLPASDSAAAWVAAPPDAGAERGWTNNVAEVTVWPYNDDLVAAVRQRLAPLAATVEQLPRRCSAPPSESLAERVRPRSARGHSRRGGGPRDRLTIGLRDAPPTSPPGHEREGLRGPLGRRDGGMRRWEGLAAALGSAVARWRSPVLRGSQSTCRWPFRRDYVEPLVLEGSMAVSPLDR